MKPPPTTPQDDATSRARAAIPLAILAFLSLILASTLWLDGVRLDLTEGRLYTLSDSTEALLEGIEEPVTLRLYLSRDLVDSAPRYGLLGQRVAEMLEQFEALAGGMIRFERIDPLPFSEAEDQAVAYGLRGVPLNAAGDLGYFGLAGTNSTDDLEVIPFIALEREAFLEYDLAKLVYDLAEPDKPLIGLIDGVQMAGGQTSGFQPFQVLTQLRELFRVREITGGFDSDFEDLDLLLLVHPKGLEDAVRYRIDQAVLGGLPAVIAVDPHAEIDPAARPSGFGMPEGDTASDLPDLFAAWGIAYDREQAVADRLGALPVQMEQNGRPVITAYPVWFDIGGDSLNAEDPITANLPNLSFRSPGSVGLTEAGAARLTLTPLATSSAEAMPVDAVGLRSMTDPRALLTGFAATGERYPLIALIEGPMPSAFPDGPPETEGEDPPFADRAPLAESTGDARLLILTDVDYLADATWLTMQNFLGQRIATPVAANGDLVVNAAERLTGAPGLIGLRGRGLVDRPFTRIEALQRDAEQQFRATEQALLTELEETTARLRSLEEAGIDDSGAIELSQNQLDEIEQFRLRQLDIREELRAVQRNLRKDIETLQNSLRWLNILAVPGLVLVAAIGIAVWRGRRRRAALTAGG